MITGQDVSVVVPIYNGADKLSKVVESFMAQTLRPAELIVVNDGSTDDIINRVVEYAKYPWFKFFTKKNGGPGSARNYGMAVAHGEYIAFLDADDEWMPEKIERQVQAINDYNGARPVGISDTYVAIVAYDGTIKFDRRNKSGNTFSDFLLENMVNATSSVMVNKNIALEVGGFPEDFWFGEDRLLWLRISHVADIVTAPEILVRKINTEGNLTSRKKENYEFILKYIDRMVEDFSLQDLRKKIFFANTRIIFNDFSKQGDVVCVRKCFLDSVKIDFLKTMLSIRPVFFVGTFFGSQALSCLALTSAKCKGWIRNG